MNVKVYNIKNTDRFFDMLEHCEGDILLISNREQQLPLKSKTSIKGLQIVRMAYARGTIHEMELCFPCADDAIRVVRFLMDMNNAA